MSGSVLGGLDPRYWRPGVEPGNVGAVWRNAVQRPQCRFATLGGWQQHLSTARTMNWRDSDWTVTVRLDDQNTGGSLNTYWHIMPGALWVGLENGTVLHGYAVTAIATFSCPGAPTGRITSVTIRRTGASTQVWVDGVLAGTGNSDISGYYTTIGPVFGFGYTNGRKDYLECAVWQRALSDAEMRAAANGTWLPTMNDSSLKAHYTPESVRTSRWCDVSPNAADLFPEVGASYETSPIADHIIRSIPVTIQNTTIPGFLGTGSAALDLGDYAANLRAGDKIEVRTTGLPTDLEIDYAVCSVNGAASVRLINLSGSELASGNVAATLVHTIV